MAVPPEVLQVHRDLAAPAVGIAQVHERADDLAHSLTLFQQHLPEFAELRTRLGAGLAVGGVQSALRCSAA